jgi:hypothetical protein
MSTSQQTWFGQPRGLTIWSAGRLSRLNIPRRSRVGGFVTVVGLLGVAWIGIIGGLIRLSLNY